MVQAISTAEEADHGKCCFCVLLVLCCSLQMKPMDYAQEGHRLLQLIQQHSQ
jgi:hypothetical protein